MWVKAKLQTGATKINGETAHVTDFITCSSPQKIQL